MAASSTEEYVFKKTGDNEYVRKCFGIEITGCKMAELCDGFTHLNVSAAVKINGVATSPMRSSLEPHARAAWTALRHLIPGIANRCFKLPPPDESFAFRYTVPTSPADVEAWVNETVSFSDDLKPFREAHRWMKDNHWWLPSADHYVAELHIAPLENGWNFSMSLLHSHFDGRAAFSVMDIYLKFLTAELQGRAKPVSAIEWGTETVRLQLPGPFTVSIAETGQPPEMVEQQSTVQTTAEPKEDAEEKPAVKPWLYSPAIVNGHGDVSQIVTFSRETTENLHATSKKHGYTMTQLFTALYILAHVEAGLRTASNNGTERFRELSGTFKDATHYLIAWTFMNQRHKLPGGYNSFESERGSPLLAQDGTSPLLPMDVVRSMFKIDESSNSAERVVDAHAFWDGLVKAVALAWKAIDQSLEAYLAREMAGHATSQKFEPAAFHIPALIISSIGDLGRLGVLTNYLPGSSEHSTEGMPTITVEDVVTGLRSRIPITVNLLYQYDGQLSSHFATAGEHTTQEALQLETDILKEWVDALVTGL